ncbi:hypothetical protein FDECE_8695 [Fusarium decemcellulare]|nr:hypothetical protein FDECE_8695 [Fusarium decemcellulare]
MSELPLSEPIQNVLLQELRTFSAKVTRIATLSVSAIAAVKSAWTRGSPFAAATALFPTTDEGKYVIQAEGIRMAFTNYGGAVTNLWLNNSRGEEVDVVLGLDQAADYEGYPGNPYLNGAIGRYAGFLRGGSFEMDGETYHVATNSHNGSHTFNGGDRGWGRNILDIGSHTENSITFVLFDRSWNGFPGTAASCLTHTVTPYEWRIAFGVTPTKKPGPINMSQQAFFNLDGFKSRNSTLAEETSDNTILNHHLHLPLSGLRFDTDTSGLSNGDILGNRRGSKHDFWSASRRIGDVLGRDPSFEVQDKGQKQWYNNRNVGHRYDTTFQLGRTQPWNKEDTPAAVLSSAQSGITMSLYTDQEALHVHTWSQEQGKYNFTISYP